MIDIVCVECIDGWLIQMEDAECMQVSDSGCIRLLDQDAEW